MIKHSIWSGKIKAIAVLCLLAALTGMASSGTKAVMAPSGTAALPAPSGIAAVVDQSSLQLPVQQEYIPDTSAGTLQCKYFNEKDFMSSVLGGLASVPANPAPGRIAGGVVPHHLLADEMIAGFFEILSHSSPDVVVVIAPNHKRTGAKGIHTSLLSWGTAFGTLEADRPLAEALIRDFNASQDTLLMEEEHSISSLVPYIKYYLPNTRIVPVLLHGNYSAEDSAELGEWLAGLLSNPSDTPGKSSCSKTTSDSFETSDNFNTSNTLNAPNTSVSSGSSGFSGSVGSSNHPCITVIASVDFSHYLDRDTANRMDEKTLAAIQSYDISTISKMGNDNLDSPPSITVLLSAMEMAGISAPKVLARDNSSNITGTGADYTTSYYTLLYSY